MSYEAISHFAQTWGMLYFVLIFGVALAYALWPKNKDTFKRAANLPANEKEQGDDRPLA
ncbi:MAG: cbb3-type cytochrome c oxidase subunit 3 [Hyphomonadaceae bacterium]